MPAQALTGILARHVLHVNAAHETAHITMQHITAHQTAHTHHIRHHTHQIRQHICQISEHTADHTAKHCTSHSTALQSQLITEFRAQSLTGVSKMQMADLWLVLFWGVLLAIMLGQCLQLEQDASQAWDVQKAIQRFLYTSGTPWRWSCNQQHQREELQKRRSHLMDFLIGIWAFQGHCVLSLALNKIWNTMVAHNLGLDFGEGCASICATYAMGRHLATWGHGKTMYTYMCIYS